LKVKQLEIPSEIINIDLVYRWECNACKCYWI